jgi:hypothetical protein
MAGKKKGRPDTKPSEGRDSQGRFAKGWKGGPGNPEFNRLREYRAAVEKEIPPNTCVIASSTSRIASSAPCGVVTSISVKATPFLVNSAFARWQKGQKKLV